MLSIIKDGVLCLTGNIGSSNVIELDVCNGYNHARSFRASLSDHFEHNVFPLLSGCSYKY